MLAHIYQFDLSFYPYLREVSNKMTALIIISCQYIEEKGLHIIIQCFMVKKKFGEKTQILTIYLVSIPINLKYRQGLMSVNFVGRRMEKTTLVLQNKQG